MSPFANKQQKSPAVHRRTFLSRTVMHQQVYIAIVLEFTVYSIVPGREPRVRIQQRLNGAVFKADDCILRRRHICKPQSIDGIQTNLTQVGLDRFPGILHTGKLHISISIVWVAVGVNIGFRFAITAFSHQGRGYYLVIITVSMTVGWWYHPAAPILHLFHGSGMNPRSWLCG